VSIIGWTMPILADDNPLSWVAEYWYFVLLIGAWIVAQLKTRKSKEAEKRQREVREILKRTQQAQQESQQRTARPAAPARPRPARPQPARPTAPRPAAPARPTPPRPTPAVRPTPPRPAATPTRPAPAAPRPARPRPVAQRPGKPAPRVRPPASAETAQQVACPRCGSRMVARGQVDDATLFMCSRFPMCPTVTRVERTARAVVRQQPPPAEEPVRPVKPRSAAVPTRQPAQPAPAIVAASRPPISRLVQASLLGDPAELQRAIVLSEVLAPPLALRDRPGPVF
jgi:hypothetical protein